MSCTRTLSNEVILEALRCCRDVYPHDQDFLVSRKIAGHTILAVEGTKEKTDWITNLKFLPSFFSFSLLLVVSSNPYNQLQLVWLLLYLHF